MDFVRPWPWVGLAPSVLLFGLGLYGLHFTNALAHLGAALASGTYNPGALASAVINLLLSLWVAYACFAQGSMRRRGMAVLVLAGTLLSVILIGSSNLFAGNCTA